MKFPKLEPPSGEHWLGTNDQFYDIWSRVIWGARTALEVVVLSVILSILYRGPARAALRLRRRLDRPPPGVRHGRDLRLPVPAAGHRVLLPPRQDLLGGGVVAAALSLTVIYIPQYFRVVRNTTVSTRETTYVEAARAIGAPPVGRSCASTSSATSSSRCRSSAPSTPPTPSAPWPPSASWASGSSPTEASEWGYDLSRALDDAQAGVWWPALWPGPGDHRC